MAVLTGAINVLGDCSVGTAQTGRQYGKCIIPKGKIKHFFLNTSGKRYPLTTDFNLALFEQEQQKRNITSLANAKVTEWQGGENTFQTDADGVDTLDVLGLPKYKVTFKEDDRFYKELVKLRSFGRYDLMIADVNDTLYFATYGVQGIGGLTIGQISDDLTLPELSGQEGSKSIIIQLTDRAQFDNDVSKLSKGQHGIKFSTQTGVNPAVLATVGAGAGSALIVDVKLADNATGLNNMATANFKVTYDGADNIVTNAVADGTIEGRYTLTLTTAMVAGKNVNVSTYDGALAVSPTVVNGFIYDGKSADAVVA